MIYVNTSNKTNKGFTLIELMIVIAIIGVLAGVAIPSYTGYVNTAKMSLVKSNVVTLNNYLINSFSKEVSRQALGQSAGSDSLPVTASALIIYLNATLQASSPEGSGAFASSSNSNTGQIGINLNVSGSSWVNGDSVVVSVPAYIDITPYTFTVDYK